MSSNGWDSEGSETGPARKDARGAVISDKAWEAAVEGHLEIVHRYAYRRCRDEDMAAEVVLHTFEVVRRHWDESEPLEVSVAWVLGIARNKVRECRRRRRARMWLERTISAVWPQGLPDDKQPFQTSAPPSPSESAIASEEARQLQLAIDGLPEDQREAVLLRYTLQLSIAEVATVMGRSVKSVDGLLARARRSLYESSRQYFEAAQEGDRPL